MSYNSGLGSQGAWLIPDLAAINAAYDIYSNTGAFEVSAANRLADNYSAEEKTLGTRPNRRDPSVPVGQSR